MNNKRDLEDIQAMRDTLDSIRLEIRDDHQSGIHVTKVTLSQKDADEIDVIKANLEVEGRTFEFDPGSRKLTIDSSECVAPDV